MRLNYFPIFFDFSDYQVVTEPYSDERLTELREKHNDKYSFFRAEDEIIISNKDDDENLLNGNEKTKSVYDDIKVTSSLVKHLFFRTFKDRFKAYKPVSFYPFQFYSEKIDEDLILGYLPEELKHKIAYKKLIEIQLRETFINNVKQLNFVINIRRNWFFDISCSELVSQGYNIEGLDVMHSEVLPGLEDVIAPNQENIGIVDSVKESNAFVNTNEGVKSYPLEELFLKKSKYNIESYLKHTLGESVSESIMSSVEAERIKRQSSEYQFEEVVKIARLLFLEESKAIFFENKDGFCFRVSANPQKVFNSIALKTPTFIYDYAGTKTHSYSADKGLTSFGPYDSSTFDIKTPNILAICNKNNRGQFSKFLFELKDGLPTSSYFKKGLLKKYELSDITYNIKEVSDSTYDEYIKAFRSESEEKPDLVLIEIPDSFKSLADNSNPYYRLKAKLLSLEIPVQFIRYTTVIGYNEYILNSLGLQIYAKLGGTPWVLPSQRSVDREIIVGVGHSWLRNNMYRGADSRRVVGITTFLSGDGQYLLGDRIKDVTIDDYFDELLKSLKHSINKLSEEYAWEKGDTVRLIFHIFKPIRNVEYEVISKLIKDINEYKIKFAFVTISKTHPGVLYDEDQRGTQRNNAVIGKYIPARGSCIFLDDETSIVQMLGVRELKTSKHGMSHPIQIRIRKPEGKYYDESINDLIFYDLAYITQQIYSFTYLSWRSFFPKEEPATMFYSNLISRLLGKLSNIEGWNADSLNYNLKRKKWFL